MNLIKRIRGRNETRGLTEAEGGLSTLRRELDRAFQRTFGGMEWQPWRALDAFEAASWPAVDVSEDDKSVSIQVDVPGLAAKDVDVEVSGNLLTIKGTRQEERERRDDGWYRHERFSGSFSRSVTLPPSVDAGRVEARYDNGVLTVTAPKVPGAEPKKVKVAG